MLELAARKGAVPGRCASRRLRRSCCLLWHTWVVLRARLPGCCVPNRNPKLQVAVLCLLPLPMAPRCSEGQVGVQITSVTSPPRHEEAGSVCMNQVKQSRLHQAAAGGIPLCAAALRRQRCAFGGRTVVASDFKTAVTSLFVSCGIRCDTAAVVRNS